MFLFTESYETEHNINLSLPPVEQIESGKDMPTLYRVAFKNQLPSLFAYGYNRAFTASKGGNMYGPGVYCTFNLEDSINNVKTKPEYGDCIVEMRLAGGFNGFIIFDKHLAFKTYGQNWTIKNQLINAGFDPNDAAKMERACIIQSNGNLYRGRTAPAALELWHNLRTKIFTKYNIRGIIYKGNRDGHCALPYDFSSVIPYAVSFDKGKTFKKQFNAKLYDFLQNSIDTFYRYGGKYELIFNSVKGFTMVGNKEGKYNLIQNKTNTLISDLWFDEVDGQVNANTGVFGFTVDDIHFYATVNSPDGNHVGCILDIDATYFCDFGKLRDLIQDIKAHGTNSFSEYRNMPDDDEEFDEFETESVKIINNLIKEAVQSAIYEHRTSQPDGTVTIDNFDDVRNLLIKPENQDDVWFVQIVKRHKDNPHLHFQKNACEYVTSYYINSPEELEAKRNEIITICNATNSRAYIHPNKRSLISITDYANNVLKPRFKRHKNYYYQGHELDIAAGQSKDWPDRKLCFLDIDSDDERIYRRVMKLLADNDVTPIWEYRSVNNGWHILLPDKDKVRHIDFSVIDNGKNFGRFATVGLEIDKMILLYANLKPNGYAVQQQVQRYKARKHK